MKLSSKNLSMGSIKKFTKHIRYGERIDAERDWLALLAVCVVILAASAVWNTVLFFHVQEGDVVGQSTTALHGDALPSLAKVKTLFESRAAEEDHYRNDYRFVDPSVSGG